MVDMDDGAKVMLGKLAKLLQMDSEGKFNARKQLFKDQNINWRQFHRLLEAFDLKNLAKIREEEKIIDEKRVSDIRGNER
jgi:hypothetical protein